ncbi:hypothetical protein WG66_007994 [Moniliophthora roreri]|nr:hypothetical protein WG66_007994 [Moniliophthora roreri]
MRSILDSTRMYFDIALSCLYVIASEGSGDMSSKGFQPTCRGPTKGRRRVSVRARLAEELCHNVWLSQVMRIYDALEDSESEESYYALPPPDIHLNSCRRSLNASRPTTTLSLSSNPLKRIRAPSLGSAHPLLVYQLGGSVYADGGRMRTDGSFQAQGYTARGFDPTTGDIAQPMTLPKLEIIGRQRKDPGRKRLLAQISARSYVESRYKE